MDHCQKMPEKQRHGPSASHCLCCPFYSNDWSDIDSVSQHDSESESSDCLGAMVSKEKLELLFQI